MTKEFGMKLSLVKINTNPDRNHEIFASINLRSKKPLALLKEAWLWLGAKKLELQNQGIDPKSLRIIVSSLEGTERPQWLFNRLRSQGIKVLD